MEQLFAEKPYLTRLYTTLSAEEMTVDPMFAYNPDLPQVSNIRFAGARWDCGGSRRTPLEKWELVVTLSDGREVRSLPFADGARPFPLPAGQPAAAAIEQLRTSGPPETIRRLTAVETAGTAAAVPEDWALLQNYPNPFNQGTVLSFVAPRSAHAALHVYNLRGQKVRTLVDGPVPAGRRQVAWDGPRPQRPCCCQRRISLPPGGGGRGADAQAGLFALTRAPEESSGGFRGRRKKEVERNPQASSHKHERVGR